MSQGKRECIERALCGLLIQQGYEKTTYSSVAKACGCERAHVQYYYPDKRQFAVGFYRRVLRVDEEFLAGRGLVADGCDAVAYSHKVGQLSYAFLQMDDDLRRFTGEILEYRSIGRMLIDMELEWIGRRFQTEARHGDGFDEFAFWNGGVFECLYESALAGRVLDPDMVAVSMIRNGLRALGNADDDLDERLAASRLDDDVVAEGCAHLKGVLGAAS